MTQDNQTIIKPEHWIDAGYHRFNQVKHVRGYAEFGLQKLFSDDIGKKYYLAVFVYDNSKYQHLNMSEFTYEPDVQFCLDNKPTVNIQLGLSGNNWSIDGIEKQVEELWEFLGKPYYEKWN